MCNCVLTIQENKNNKLLNSIQCIFVKFFHSNSCLKLVTHPGNISMKHCALLVDKKAYSLKLSTIQYVAFWGKAQNMLAIFSNYNTQNQKKWRARWGLPQGSLWEKSQAQALWFYSL